MWGSVAFFECVNETLTWYWGCFIGSLLENAFECEVTLFLRVSEKLDNKAVQ
jgi:hypothetical protein